MYAKAMMTVVGVMMLGSIVPSSSAQKPDLRDFMRAKLSHSQTILEGRTWTPWPTRSIN